MAKYLLIIRNTFEEYFIYRVNFLLWRLRNVLGFLTGYFLIKAIFTQGKVIYGYDLEKILTYLFSVSILRAVVFSSRTVDLAGVIQSGNLTNILIKPISPLLVWFSRDLADKILNIFFSLLELGLIIYLVKPPLFVQSNPFYLFLFLFLVGLALVLYFLINFLLSLVGFWTPEVWAPRFLFNILLNFFSGGIVPLDVLPKTVRLLFQLTPFPYLLFNPIAVYLGKVPLLVAAGMVLIGLFWMGVFYSLVQFFWQKGLLVYESEGR